MYIRCITLIKLYETRFHLNTTQMITLYLISPDIERRFTVTFWHSRKIISQIYCSLSTDLKQKPIQSIQIFAILKRNFKILIHQISIQSSPSRNMLTVPTLVRHVTARFQPFSEPNPASSIFRASIYTPTLPPINRSK